jgi:hypothetical protein
MTRNPRCLECGHPFGLIRWHRWRHQFCSRKCLERFTTRQERHRRYLIWLKTGTSARGGEMLQNVGADMAGGIDVVTDPSPTRPPSHW